MFKLKDWQRLLDFCLEWTKKEQKNDGAWNSTSGPLIASLKRYNDAIEAYRQAVRINPKNVKNLGQTSGPFTTFPATRQRPWKLSWYCVASIQKRPRRTFLPDRATLTQPKTTKEGMT